MYITIFSEVTIDGKLTLGRGSSSKVLFDMLDQSDLEYIHEFRSRNDGILVGINTVRMDNPSLTCRYGSHPKNPIRIIFTNSLNIPKDAVVLTDNNKTIFVTTEANRDRAKSIMERNNKECLFCGKNGKVDVVKAIEELENKYNIHSIMVEGGGEINWSLLEKNIVNHIILMQLPIIAGGRDNISLVQGEGFKSLEQVSKFNLVNIEQREKCIVLEYKK